MAIEWVLGTQLEDLDFVDVIALASGNVETMQGKKNKDDLHSVGSKIRREINKGKTNVMKKPSLAKGKRSIYGRNSNRGSRSFSIFWKLHASGRRHVKRS